MGLGFLGHQEFMVAPVRLSRARTLATYREVTLAYKSYDTVANTKKERSALGFPGGLIYSPLINLHTCPVF